MSTAPTLVTSAAGYTSLTELLVADYKANGRKRWIRTVVPFPNDPKPEVFPWAMAVGPGESVYVACDYYYDELNYGWALVKLDARGRLSWVVTRPNGWSERLATDTEGNIYATGYGRARVGSYWGEECVTEKYSPAGELLWSSTYIPDASLQAWGEELEVVGTSVVVSGHVHVELRPHGPARARLRHQVRHVRDRAMGEVVDAADRWGGLVRTDSQ